MVLAHDIRDVEGVKKRTADIATDAHITFDSMLLAPRTLSGLTAAGFTRPSPVQLQGIPTGKCGFNLLLEAKSGTGKTAVFAVIALEMLDAQEDAQIMILAPTREIAAQITDVIRQIGSDFEGLTVEVVMGGLPLSDDIEKFAKKRKVHIVVGSPGRLRHLIQKNYIDTASIRLFVLDEADKLMEGSFKADINYIFSSLPNCKQVIMSSATYPESLRELVVKYASKYLHICPDSTSILLGIEQMLTVVKEHANIIMQTQFRYDELLKIFQSRQFKQCLIFCNYQARVLEVCKKLKADKWPVQFLHGKQQQTDRLDALKTLQEYKCRILVSTDLAARGIDASNVDLVINFEIPYDWTTYLHRIGRAGRYGSYGMAISIVAKGKEETRFEELMKQLGGPVNIRYLWTDAPVCLSEVKCMNSHENGLNGNKCETKKEIDVDVVNKSTDALWNIINNRDEDTKKDEQVIEDFNNLTASYNDADSIESFDNLLSSFEQSNTEKTDVVFKTLEVHSNNNINKWFSIIGTSDVKLKIASDKSEKNIDIVNDVVPQFNGEPSTCSVEKTPSKNTIPKNISNKKKRTTEISSGDVKKNDNFNSNCFLHLNGQNYESAQEVSGEDDTHYNHSNDDYCDVINTKNSIMVNGKKHSHQRRKWENNKNRATNKNTTSNFSKDTSLQELDNNYNNYKNISIYPHNSWKKANAKDVFQTSEKIETNSKNQNVSSSECESSSASSESDSNSESESDECSEDENDLENQRTARNKLHDKHNVSESIAQKAYRIAAIDSYEMWKRQVAARRAQIQMVVYIEEMGKLS